LTPTCSLPGSIPRKNSEDNDKIRNNATYELSSQSEDDEDQITRSGVTKNKDLMGLG